MRAEDRWLWDRSGIPDAPSRRLEEALASLADAPEEPTWPKLAPRHEPGWRAALIPLVAAAALVLVLGLALMTAQRGTWSVRVLAGRPRITGWAQPFARLSVGGALTTRTGERARLSFEDLGWVEIEPNSVVELVRGGRGVHRLALERGELSAVIVAPPRTFVVETPAAVATDLGCAYRLRVDDTGDGELRVTSGWVAFTFGGRESFVPSGARCRMARGIGPGTPRFDDAPLGLVETVDRLDRGAWTDRSVDVARALAAARPRDALTLWHLISRVSPDEREAVAARLAEFVPRPSIASAERIAALDRAALDAWWDALGFGSSAFWRGWEGEFPGGRQKPGG